MSGASFVIDILFEDTGSEVLQLPVLRPKTAKKLLGNGLGPGRTVPILGSGSMPTTEDTLAQFLQHAGMLFGRDPAKWEKIGEPTTNITEQDGKRIIKRTGMYTGTELHLIRMLPYYDQRLPLRPDQPELEFALQQYEITSDEEWQQVLADQPLTASRRRQLLLNFLQAKLEAEDEQLVLEGARGMWELSINKQHQAEMELRHLQPIMRHLQHPNIEISRECAATVWGLAINEQSRALLLQLNVVEVLLSVARHSLNMQCMGDQDMLPGDYVAGGKCSQTQRNQLQACVLGALSVLIVDRACRQPLTAAEPSCATLFELSSDLEGYEDRSWAAARREAAAKAITSLMQRDHEARSQLIMMGGINQILAQLEAKGPGRSKVQYCMAALLATLVLDDQAMEILQQRGEGHLVFEAALKLLSHVLNALKFTLAVPGAQILSEGMTQAEVHAAMEQLRSQSAAGGEQRVSTTGHATPLMQTAARRLSQEAALSSSSGDVTPSPAVAAPAARRLSAEAVATAAVLQEASQLSRLSATGHRGGSTADEDAQEPLDVYVAVSLAEACAQAVWGAAYYSLEQPLHITQDHVVELGKISLDCLIISEMDLGRVCHCLAATLASLAGNEMVASFIMDAPADSVAKTLLTLLEVEDEPGFSNAGHVRAAASTCLAYLACHTLGAKGDSCLWGPFRTKLLSVGTLGALLKAALMSASDDPCNNIIQQTAAVGIMYLTTMANAVDPAELAMYAALMTSTNVNMVEFLMAGCWLLLKNPTNRQVLGNAFNANPASTKLAHGMMQKLQATVDVADVNEAAETLMKVRPAGSAHHAGSRLNSAAGATAKPTSCYEAHVPHSGAEAQQTQQQDQSAGAIEPATTGEGASAAGTVEAEAVHGAQQPAPTQDLERFELPSGDAAVSTFSHDSRPASSQLSQQSGGLEHEASFGALAAEADTMEDKLKLLESKRKSSFLQALEGVADPAGSSRTPRSRVLSASPAAAEKVKELTKTMQEEGADSKRTLEKVKSIGSLSLSRGLDNLDQQLGLQLQDNWGLDVLVRVGETWLPKLRDAGGVPPGQSMGGGKADAEEGESNGKADVPLLKLFEFLTASLCLYVIEEDSTGCPLRRMANVFSTGKAGGSDGSPSWWTVAAPMIQTEPALSPLMLRAMHILLTLLQLRLPAAWKSMQLSVVMLWNAAVQSGAAEAYQVREGICSTLLEQVNSSLWPPTLRDMAAGQLQFLMESHNNLLHLGEEWQHTRMLDQAKQRPEAAAAAVAESAGSNSGEQAGSISIPALSGSSARTSGSSSVYSSKQLSPLPFNLAALLNPAAAAAKARQGLKQQQQPDPVHEALKAAGGHPGLVAVLSCYIGLMRTGHQMLELRGASGIARMCFAAAMGAPSPSQLLMETKATAAAVGAIGALVDLLRLAATRFMVLEDGGVLPPPPNLSQLVDREYTIYERDTSSKEGVLEVLTAVLAALLNMSTLLGNQPKIARRGLTVLLKANSSLFQVVSSRDCPSEDEMKLLDMLAAILQNLASHPDNRTVMYRAELAGTTALDRMLEGPSSPEPTESSATLLAGRFTAKCTASSPQRQAAAGSSMDRSSSALGLQPPGRCQSPTLGGAAPQCGGRSLQGNRSLSKSLNAKLSPSTVVRPKVLFPPISRSTAGMLAASSGTREQWIRAASPPATGQQQQQQQGLSPPASPTAAGQASPSRQGPRGQVGFNPPPSAGARAGIGHGRSPHRNRSIKSRAATSVAGVPGTAMRPPDSREQFLIWSDQIFDSAFSEGPGHSEGAAAGEPWAKANMGSTRRPLFDPNTGEWLQPEPESTPGLQQLLCRPLKHLWQDSPESRARDGNARWAPAVSEYRQVPMQYPLQYAAEGMLTVEPPEQLEQLQAATATFASTGRVAAVSTVSCDRPSTAQRSRGRIPLTVLAAEQQQDSGQELSSCVRDGTGSAAATAVTSHSTVSRAQGSTTGRSDSAASLRLQDEQQQQLRLSQHLSQSSAQASSANTSAALKVVLSPQRPRTIISFENRCWSSDGPGSKPVLTMFPHTEGAKVSEGLFSEYQLPNGRTAFLYCNAGTAMDEAGFAPVQPPMRPTTVPLALQQSMPLANVMSLIAKPPGTAQPHKPYKPVPRLVPLPGSHTLTVARPELRTAESYGQLRADNMQLLLKAETIMKSQTTTTEEDIHMPVPEQRDPWTLPGSIFKPRVKECDARAFYDGAATLEKLFSRDWARACGKERFTSMLARENKGSSAGKSDKVAMQEVHDVLKAHYQVVYSAFMFYATGGNDPYHMPLNSFTSFLDDAAIPDPDGLSIKRSDCDTIFIVCNFQPDKNSPDVAVNDEHAMMRFEFLEAIVRLALAKYGKGQRTDDLAQAVEMMIERNLLPRLPPQAQINTNNFRTERLYTEEVDATFQQHQSMLKALYSRYRLKPSGGGLRPKVLKLDGWLALMTEARLIDSQFTLVDATLAFLWSRMFVIDEIKDYLRYTSLSFIDLLEALGRVADAKSMPTASDLDAAGYPSILEWALDKERMEGANNSTNSNTANNSTTAAGSAAGPAPAAAAAAAHADAPEGVPPFALAVAQAAAAGGSLPEIFRPRLSARFGAPKPRPLYAKVDLLLDLIFRRLHWDPAQPEVPFSYEGLQRMIKKIDKDLGP